MPAHQSFSVERRLLAAVAITTAVFLAELLGGLWTGSLALLSDAAHVFMDLFALALSYAALRLSALPADDRYTYGYHRLEVLAALFNGVTLGGVAIAILREAWLRWQAPEPIRSLEMLTVAAGGLVANLVVMRLLGHDHHEVGATQAAPRPDLNVRSAYLHVLGDALSSVAVIAAALLIRFTGQLWVDPLASVLIGALVLLSSWRVLRASLVILSEGSPEGLSTRRVAQAMLDVAGVEDVHDLHIWSLCSGHVALSAHLVISDRRLAEATKLMAEVKEILRTRFGIEHTTVQLEVERCGQETAICSPRAS